MVLYDFICEKPLIGLNILLSLQDLSSDLN